jgi:hypothetical protein
MKYEYIIYNFKANNALKKRSKNECLLHMFPFEIQGI